MRRHDVREQVASRYRDAVKGRVRVFLLRPKRTVMSVVSTMSLSRPSTNPLDQSGAFERDAGKETFALAIREPEAGLISRSPRNKGFAIAHGRRIEKTGINGRSGSDGSSTRSYLTTDRHIALFAERSNGLVRIEDDDEFGQVSSDLEAEADAAGCYARRCRPRAIG